MTPPDSRPTDATASPVDGRAGNDDGREAMNEGLTVDLGNYQLVGMQGSLIRVMSPKSSMSKQEALVHAAWLVALADDDDSFPEVLAQVQDT